LGLTGNQVKPEMGRKIMDLKGIKREFKGLGKKFMGWQV
jgi:hypothetical protein